MSRKYSNQTTMLKTQQNNYSLSSGNIPGSDINVQSTSHQGTEQSCSSKQEKKITPADGKHIF